MRQNGVFMRMRKKKHGAERLLLCEELLYAHEGEPLTNPGSVMDMQGAPVYLEIGAGKGGFARGMAARYPDAAYFAMERVTDCVVLAAEGAKELGLSNLKFVIDSADNLTRIFAPGTVSRIFLNFSDPWSKKGYAKRRLTHRRYLSVYMNLLSDGGILQFKTDNLGLFDFSLSEIEAMGLSPEIVTRNLHESKYAEENIMTEYERNFSEAGYKINMLLVRKPVGFSPEIPADLRRDRQDFPHFKK